MTIHELTRMALERGDAKACRGYLLLLAATLRDEKNVDGMMMLLKDIIAHLPAERAMDLTRQCLETGRIDTGRTAALDSVDALQAVGRKH